MGYTKRHCKNEDEFHSEHTYQSVNRAGNPQSYICSGVPVGRKKCAQPECEDTVKNDAFTLIKNPEWFHQMNGDSWCPKHIPDWVEEWRARRKNQS